MAKPPRSSRFIVAVVALLLGLHAYIGWRILPVLALPDTLNVLVWIGLMLSALVIPLGLLSRFIAKPPLSDKLAWIGLLPMGWFSSAILLTFVRDIVLLGDALWSSLMRTPTSATLPYDSAIGVVALAFMVTLIGYINARRVATVIDIVVPIANLPEALSGYTLVQLSDIHVGPTIKRNYIEKVVRRVNKLDADAVVITGDVVDGDVAHLQPHTAPLADLKSRDGTFAVTGNHEYYSGAHQWIAEWQRLGIRVLMNEHQLIRRGDAILALGGVPDYTAHHFDRSHQSDPVRAFSDSPDGAIRVLLAHQPRTIPAAEAAGTHLQLSGHTHGGQFWPWNLFVPLQQPYVAGLVKHGSTWLYISRGTGYWGPPKRFGAPSEITRIRLVRA
ncbi:metallophosphoesterase [Burkholderiaceae bacterium DAT-1]|nr:metallophosphoesterase [Burkholderiaceae bacterium DAT-1]